MKDQQSLTLHLEVYYDVVTTIGFSFGTLSDWRFQSIDEFLQKTG